jgi:hypothetical protein
MPEGNSAASRDRLDLDFHVVGRWIRHEHRAAQFQKGWRLDYLHEAPQVSDPVASIAVPAPARLWLEQQLHGLAIRPGVTLSKTVQDGGECLFRSGLDVNVLLNVERQIFQFHFVLSWMLSFIEAKERFIIM